MPDIFVAEPNNQNTSPTEEPVILGEKINQEKPPMPINNAPEVLRNPVHFFSAFRKNPDGVTFRDQEGKEKVLLFIRRSFITNVPWIVSGLFFLLLPLLFPLILANFQNPLPSLPSRFYLFFMLLYYLFVVSFIYINFITWYFNISLVTDRRVIDINFSNLVYKDVAATKLNLVQDVSFAQVGAIRTFFDYGDVLVQTAGTLDNFTFESAPQPENVVHIIEDLIGRRRGLFG